MKKDLISIKDLAIKEIEDLLFLGAKVKKDPKDFSQALKHKALALVFQKPSNRTYVSFQVGMFQLGGTAIYLGPEHIKLGVRESIHDVAKTLSRYVQGIVLRTFEHKNVIDMAGFASIPVINGLSDFSHPCQALADIFTVKERLKGFKGATLAYVGDGNNVCHSLLYACAKVGMNMNVASPKGYEPQDKVLQEARIIARPRKAKINLYNRAGDAARNADIIYTDVWASMGQEGEVGKRKKIFNSFQVNKDLVKLAKRGVLVMHCLPAHRQEEITDEVIDSKNSVVFDQAENRMHVQKAILIKLLGEG